MLSLCFGSLMVRSLLIPRLNLFMTGLFWFCSWPFVSVPALIFSLILPLEEIFLSTGFFDFPNEAIHIEFLLFDSMALPNSCIILPCIFSNSLLYTGTQVGSCQCFEQSWEYFFKLFGKWTDWCILFVIIFTIFKKVHTYHPLCLFLLHLFSVLQFRLIIFGLQLHTLHCTEFHPTSIALLLKIFHYMWYPNLLCWHCLLFVYWEISFYSYFFWSILLWKYCLFS